MTRHANEYERADRDRDYRKHERRDQMRIHPKVTLERIMEACERRQSSLDDPGFCVLCSEEAEGVEPDARRYKCEFCGEFAVYGAEELLIRIAL